MMATPSFGVLGLPTVHMGLRKALNLETDEGNADSNVGILVYNILPGSSADTYLREGDVLLKINGKTITARGEVRLSGSWQDYTQLVDNLHVGDIVKVEILRNNKRLQLRIPSKITKAFAFRRRNYNKSPSYWIIGGLVFQPVNANLARSYSKQWLRLERPEILFRYQYFFLERIYKEVEQSVVLTRRLPDPINAYTDDFQHRLVKKVNGEKVLSFSHFRKLTQKAIASDEYLVIDFHNVAIPLVLRVNDLKASSQKILRRYGISRQGTI